MYKKIMIIIVLLLLVGCTENEDLDSLKKDMDETNQQIELMQQTNEELNSRLNQLISDVEDKNSEIQEMKNAIDTLNQSKRSYFSSAYKDYMISFAYDVVRELESYSSYYGIITNYDKDLETVEVASMEFVYVNDFKRIAELNIDTDATQAFGDIYIYIGYDDKVSYELSENFELYVYDWDGSGGLKVKSLEQEIEDASGYENRYLFSMIGNKIIRMTEFHND